MTLKSYLRTGTLALASLFASCPAELSTEDQSAVKDMKNAAAAPLNKVKAGIDSVKLAAKLESLAQMKNGGKPLMQLEEDSRVNDYFKSQIDALQKVLPGASIELKREMVQNGLVAGKINWERSDNIVVTKSFDTGNVEIATLKL